MELKTKTLVIATLILVAAFAASYFSFSSYKPKTIQQVQEVRGISNESNSDLPLPEGAKKASTNKSTEAEQLTFHIEKSKEDVQSFYKNIFSNNKWTLESQGVHDTFITTRYYNEEKYVNVTTLDTDIENDTLVSLEVTYKN